MSKRIFEQLGGMVTVKLKGKNLEKVVNMAMARGIFLWNIKKSDDGISFRVRQSGFNALQSLTAEGGFELEATRRQGLPFFKQVLKRRMGFLAGALFFVAALYCLSSFVWLIEVSGNRVVGEERILDDACRLGIYRGAAKWNFSTREVEDALLRDISEISYVRVNIKGVKARIEIVEKVLPSQEITGPCHIVAVRDGVVDDILVLNGQAAVKPGDVVVRGDVLISGLLDPPSSPYVPESEEEIMNKKASPVRARGSVMARVWYEGYGECAMTSEKLVLTGERSRMAYIETPWRKLVIKKGTEFAMAQNSTAVKKFNTPWGECSLVVVTAMEQSTQREEHPENEAVNIARERALKNLADLLHTTKPFNDCRVEVLSSPSDPILRVKVAVEVIEDIGQPQSFAPQQMAKK
ncbi:MAG: sporulation protein YqfD [Syntrophomonas sp.]